MAEQIIRTSQQGWLAQLTEAYRKRYPVLLIDDAGVGVQPDKDSLLQMARRSRLTFRDWSAVVVSLGVSGFGAWTVVAAVLDPEPTSKLLAMVLAGSALAGGGGFMAVRLLTGVRPPNVRVTHRGIEIDWHS